MPKKQTDKISYWLNAFEDAIIFHEGEIDKSSNPYIYHPLRVSCSFLQNIGIEDDDVFNCATVGLLHDVIESCPSSRSVIIKDYPEEIYEAVDALTQREDETYRQYIKRLCHNDIARKVKIADVKDNLSPVRLFSGAPIMKYHKTLGWIEGFELTGKFD